MNLTDLKVDLAALPFLPDQAEEVGRALDDAIAAGTLSPQARERLLTLIDLNLKETEEAIPILMEAADLLDRVAAGKPV